MKYKELTIGKCIDLINETLFLPDIQRPYVWEESDIYLLYDSVCRDYPINTVLFWFLKKETLQQNAFIKKFKFISERLQENQIDTSPLQRDNYFLAIDGQQRITTFYLTLHGTYKIKIKKTWQNADLYYNFISGVEENEDGILYEFKFFPTGNPDVFIETVQDKKSNSVANNYWLRVKYIYSLDKLYEVQSKTKEKIKTVINFDISDALNNNIFRLWSKLRHEELISYYEEQTQDYDKVLDIFVRTNSGGQKLKYSDLLFSYIKLHWNEARDKFSSLLKNLNENGKFDFDHDFILKTILFINANDQEQLKYRTKNFTPNIIIQTRDTWETKLEPAIKLMKDLLVSRFQLSHGKLITSYNALIPIIYFNYHFDKKGIGEESNKLTLSIQLYMREWLLTCMLTGVFGGQSDSILNKSKKALEESGKLDYYPKDELYKKINEAKPALTLKVTEEIISKASYNSVESHLILSLLYKNTVNLSPLLDDNKPQQDHIFSKDELKVAGVSKDKINSIYNIRWVSASDNRIKSNESYAEWSERMNKKDVTILSNHFIPTGSWNISNFDNFLIARKQEFSKQIIGNGSINATNNSTSTNIQNTLTIGVQ